MMSEQNSSENEISISPNKKNRSSFLSKLLLFLVIFPLLSLSLFYFSTVPVGQISKLKDHYVSTQLKKEKGKKYAEVTYKITSKKPKDWFLLKEMDHNSFHAIVVSEDWAFYQHRGIDFGQIKEAVSDYTKGKNLRGASTITQQLVKNLFLNHERSLSRKLKEALMALTIEQVVSKEKILEIYLNIVEFGPNIYGIGAASKYYFKKSAKELHPKEGAFLAMVLPNPKRYSESFRQKKLTKYAKETIDKIVNKMQYASYIKKEELEKEKEKSLIFYPDQYEDLYSDKTKRPRRKDDVVIKAIPKEASLRRRRKAALSDGREYEQRMRVDSDLLIDDDFEINESSQIIDTSGLKEEFSVD